MLTPPSNGGFPSRKMGNFRVSQRRFSPFLSGIHSSLRIGPSERAFLSSARTALATSGGKYSMHAPSYPILRIECFFHIIVHVLGVTVMVFNKDDGR